MNIVETKHLRIEFKFGDKTSVPVRDVSIAIPPGGRVALVGESGCGKSLTALAIGGLVERAEISGEIVFPASGGRRPVISYVFQNPMQSLDPVMRVGAQIAESAEARRKRCDVASLLSDVGLDPAVASRYPCELSGGQCQRIMIATALAAQPELLVADEPTTALDVTTQAEVLELIGKVTAERGTATLFITHNLGLVAKYSDVVNVMYAGEIVESGQVLDIMSSPRHPYTKGLLAAVPRLDAPKDAPIRDIPGVVPPPWNWPEGCAFRPRCSEARETCGDAKKFNGCPLVFRRGFWYNSLKW